MNKLNVTAQTSLATLISAYAETRKFAVEAEERADAIWKDSARPAYPHISPRELGWPFKHHADNREVMSLEQLNKVFDREVFQANQNLAFFTMPRGPGPELVRAHEKRLAGIEVERAKALATFSQRSATYEAWKQASGHVVAMDETERFFQQFYDLEDLIIDFQCGTLEEVVLKARFIWEYEDAILTEALAGKVFAQLATIKTGTDAPSRLREESA